MRQNVFRQRMGGCAKHVLIVLTPKTRTFCRARVRVCYVVNVMRLEPCDKRHKRFARREQNEQVRYWFSVLDKLL